MSTPLLQSLEQAHAQLPSAALQAGLLGEARRASLAAALADGLPGARAERWRHTSLRALERRSFAAPVAAAVDASLLPETTGVRIAFVNGVFAPELSCQDALPEGVELLPLSKALKQHDARELSFLARRFDAADDTFARLNAAFALDGMMLRVPAGLHCDVPVELVIVGASSSADRAVHLRHLVELGDGASLRLIERQISAGSQAHLVNSLSHIHLKRGARLDHLRVQCEDAAATLFTRTEAVLASEADYRRADLELGAALSRHEFNVALQGNGARLRSNGVLLADGRRHLDTRLGMDHIARDTQCDLTWRGLATDRGRVVFHGGILIRAGADGTAAHLSNKNLLLSPHAEIDTQPVLEIHADEVKASHGATVGQLDATALFYLRSRGVPEAQARNLLIQAFCRSALDDFDDDALREQIDTLLAAHLPGVTA